MVLWFTKKSKTNNSLSPAFATQQPVGTIDLQDLQSGCGFVADGVGEEPAPLWLLPSSPWSSNFCVQRHPVWKHWWDVVPSSTSPLLLLLLFSFPISLLQSGATTSRLWFLLWEWEASWPGCGLTGASCLWPAWRLHAGNLFTRDHCPPRCEHTMHCSGSVHSVSNPALCLCLSLLPDNRGKKMRIEWWFSWRILRVGSSAVWWGGGSILFESVMALSLNLSCPLFLKKKNPDQPNLNCERLLCLHNALVKASAANVHLKSAAWSAVIPFLQWCEKQRLILFPEVLFRLSSLCIAIIRSCVSAKVPFRVCRWHSPKSRKPGLVCR